MASDAIKRRARDSNPQPLAGQLISNQSLLAENAEENSVSQDSAAHGAAVQQDHGPNDPDLVAIIEAWPELSEAVKAAFMALLAASNDKSR